MNCIKKIIILVLVSFLLYACPEPIETYPTIFIKNKSDKDIYFWARGKSPILDWKPNNNFLIIKNQIGTLEGDNSGTYTIYIWLFDRKLIDSIPWEQVKRKNLYLKRYDLTTQDLERMNWEIIYDGS